MPIYSRTTSSSINTNTFLTLLTGTFTTAASTAVVGSGTAFLSQLKVGDYIKIGTNSYRQITAITDNTNLTVDTAFTAAVAGLSALLKPAETEPGNHCVVSILSLASNTGTIYIGQSQNAAKNGADVTTTSRSLPLAPGGVTPPIVVSDWEAFYVQCSVASQRYSILVNA
jgi:hypothetical protein